MDDIQITVYETDGTVTSMCCIVEPDNIDVNNIMREREFLFNLSSFCRT